MSYQLPMLYRETPMGAIIETKYDTELGHPIFKNGLPKLSYPIAPELLVRKFSSMRGRVQSWVIKLIREDLNVLAIIVISPSHVLVIKKLGTYYNTDDTSYLSMLENKAYLPELQSNNLLVIGMHPTQVVTVANWILPAAVYYDTVNNTVIVGTKKYKTKTDIKFEEYKISTLEYEKLRNLPFNIIINTSEGLINKPLNEILEEVS